MKDFYLRNKDFFDRIVLLLVVAGFVFAAVFLMGLIGPFVAGFIISLILNPLVGLIERKWRIHRGIAAAVLILLVIGAIFAVGGWLVGRLLEQMTALVQDIPQYIGGAQEAVTGFREGLQRNFGLTGIRIDFDALFAGLLTFITGLLQGFIEGGNILTAIPGAIFKIILTIISAFFFIKDKELIKRNIYGLFPKKMQRRAGRVRESLLVALAGYVKGQLIIMTFVATICIIGLTIIGSKYSLLIGMGIALFDIIPVLGSGGILIPWAIYSFVSGNTGFGVGLLVIWGICFLTRQFLEPKIVGKRIGIHPIVLLISIYLGITIIGPIGILAGPLITLVIKSILEAQPHEIR
ncbi:MAG: sporulation integral membrane protein YtvI [Clostridiales bacterium]|jgi:sporulation integral membrane protein YtvI|nr:sporulation integral membrane protein YtvI [Clostridiales bacterium]